MNFFLKPLMTGTIALLPIGLTLGILAWFASLTAQLFGPASFIGALFQKIGWNFGSTETGAYFGGIVFTILLVYLLGVLVQLGLRGSLNYMIQRIMSKIPVLGKIYDASSRLVMLFEQSDHTDMRSMVPVLCQFGSNASASIPALLPTSETIMIQNRECNVVMIPTAPVPFGGAIMYVPKEFVHPLDCGIDGLLSIYLSMGSTMPNRPTSPN